MDVRIVRNGPSYAATSDQANSRGTNASPLS